MAKVIPILWRLILLAAVWACGVELGRNRVAESQRRLEATDDGEMEVDLR